MRIQTQFCSISHAGKTWGGHNACDLVAGFSRRENILEHTICFAHILDHFMVVVNAYDTSLYHIKVKSITFVYIHE